MLALIALVTFTAAMYTGLTLVNRLKSDRLQHVLVSAAVLLLLPAALMMKTTGNMRMVLSLLIVALAGTAAISPTVRNLAHTVLRSLWPLVPLQVSICFWAYFTQSSVAAYEPLPARQTRADVNMAAQRVVLLLFDELDQQLAFDLLPTGVRLPNLAALQHQAFWATDTQAAGQNTTEAVPGIFLGRRVVDGDPQNANTLLLDFGASVRERWGQQDSIFSDAAALGRKSALIGWYHPYCRVLGQQVSYCQSFFTSDALTSQRLELTFRRLGIIRGSILLALSGLEFTTVGQAVHLPRYEFWKRVSRPVLEERSAVYSAMLRTAEELVKDPAFQLVVVHWPIPHLPAIYDRRLDRIGWTWKSNYFDNLLLVDRTIGDIQQFLNEAGLSQKSALLVTSDHPYRAIGDMDHEERSAFQRRAAARVPLLLRLGGEQQTIAYKAPIQATVIRPLIRKILNADFASHRDVEEWLESRQGVVALPH